MEWGVPLRDKASSDTVVEVDLGGVGGGDGGEVGVCSQEEVAVDQESGAGGDPIIIGSGDCGHGLPFT